MMKSRFFSISRQKNGLFHDFCLEMEKNRLSYYCLNDYVYSLDYGRMDLIVGCRMEDLGFESRYLSLFYLVLLHTSTFFFTNG